MVIPNTGGWQNWQTVTGRIITLESGTYTMRVEAASGSININWFSFAPTDAVADDPPEAIENSLTASSLVGDWKLAPVERQWELVLHLEVVPIGQAEKRDRY